jgi:hypothetical protein
LIVALLFLTACSEEKTPPDDEGSMEMATAHADAQKSRTLQFHECAINAIETFSLSPLERTRLSSWSFEEFEPELTDLGLFEEAKSQVRDRCQ